MNNAQLINQDSGNTEYYTPPNIIEAAREAMGGIDLDPASSDKANAIVRASFYLTEAEDGLAANWYGRVWLNHPFSRKGNPLWINKLIQQYGWGNCTAACCITFAATSEAWFDSLMFFPQCYLRPRTNYYLPDGMKKRGVTKGSVVTYLGPDPQRFKNAFEHLGSVVAPL